jgi:hypothetical protein
VVALYKLLFTGFRQGEGFSGLVLQMHHEWVTKAEAGLFHFATWTAATIFRTPQWWRSFLGSRVGG